MTTAIAVKATNISLACMPAIDPAFMAAIIDGEEVLVTTSAASVWSELGCSPRVLVHDAEQARKAAVAMVSARLRLSFDCELILDRISQGEPIKALYFGTTRRWCLVRILSRIEGRTVPVSADEEPNAIRSVAEHISTVIERETVLEDHIQYRIAA